MRYSVAVRGIAIVTILLCAPALLAATVAPSPSQTATATRAAPSPQSQTAEQAAPSPKRQDNLSVTHHSIKIAGKEIPYTATAGLMPLKNEAGKLQAEIFFVAYTRDDQPAADRPIMFAFNGGPGAATIWLHLAALGPRRVVLAQGGTKLPARPRLVDNDYSWLPFSDLVFVDPVGTGFSRAAPGIDAKQFYAMKSDVKIAGQFIRQYVTQYDRWLSPKYIAGESYGTTRAAALASHLQNNVGMLVNGLVLISSALDFQTIMFQEGNDLPYIVFLPSYTAAAWYHNKLAPALQKAPLPKVLAEAESGRMFSIVWRWPWAMPLKNRAGVRLSRSMPITRGCRRVSSGPITCGSAVPTLPVNCYEVATVFLAFWTAGLPGCRPASSSFITDPSVFLSIEPLVTTFYHYVRQDLGFQTDRKYEFLNSDISREWSWGSAAEGYPTVVPDLRQAMSANTHLYVHMACGYYDLDTAYMSQRYTAEHLLLDKSIRDHLQITYYEGGHQLYTNLSALEDLTNDIRGFVQRTEQR